MGLDKGPGDGWRHRPGPPDSGHRYHRAQDDGRGAYSSQEAAEAAVEAKAAFFANMFHKLRTPLNAVIGFSSLLLTDNLTEEEKKDIERIRNGGETLLSVSAISWRFRELKSRKL